MPCPAPSAQLRGQAALPSPHPASRKERSLSPLGPAEAQRRDEKAELQAAAPVGAGWQGKPKGDAGCGPSDPVPLPPQMRCCGVTDYTDWYPVLGENTVPDRCCMENSQGCGRNSSAPVWRTVRLHPTPPQGSVWWTAWGRWPGPPMWDGRGRTGLKPEGRWEVGDLGPHLGASEVGGNGVWGCAAGPCRRNPWGRCPKARGPGLGAGAEAQRGRGRARGPRSRQRLKLWSSLPRAATKR